MLVYEFYCPDCHTIFNFFSRRVDTETQPTCPGCDRPDLERQAYPFVISKVRGEHTEDAEPPPEMDEEQMMRAFASMVGVSRTLMRRTRTGAGMVEAIRHMDAGEDPDQIEAELGDVLEQEDPFTRTVVKSSRLDLKTLRRELMPPKRDETRYPLAYRYLQVHESLDKAVGNGPK